MPFRLFIFPNKDHDLHTGEGESGFGRKRRRHCFSEVVHTIVDSVRDFVGDNKGKIIPCFHSF